MPSGSVIIDSRELRNFVSQLKQANNELANTSRRLEAHFRRLGETWRDPAYAKFAREFQQTMNNLRRFRQASEEVAPQLLRTAERAESVHR